MLQVGAGFIGSHLVSKLLEMGHEVVVMDNLSTGFVDYLPKNPKLKLVLVDIVDLGFLPNFSKFLEGAEGVFHLAASARIQPTIDQPIIAHNNNVSGIFNILEMMRLLKIPKVIFSSSSSIYGLKNGTPSQEDMEPDCLNPYSLSKFIGENYIKVWSSLYGIKGISLRYFNVWGEREVLLGSYAPVVGLFFRQLLGEKKKLTIIGDGEQRRDFTHVSDVVMANILAMSEVGEHNSGQVVNIGSGANYSVNQLADMVLSSLGMDLNYRELLPARPAESRETRANIFKARSLLHWEPKIFIKDYINNHRDYYLKKFLNENSTI